MTGCRSEGMASSATPAPLRGKGWVRTLQLMEPGNEWDLVVRVWLGVIVGRDLYLFGRLVIVWCSLLLMMVYSILQSLSGSRVLILTGPAGVGKTVSIHTALLCQLGPFFHSFKDIRLSRWSSFISNSGAPVLRESTLRLNNWFWAGGSSCSCWRLGRRIDWMDNTGTWALARILTPCGCW